jgi:hypothetical protein
MEYSSMLDAPSQYEEQDILPTSLIGALRHMISMDVNPSHYEENAHCDRHPSLSLQQEDSSLPSCASTELSLLSDSHMESVDALSSKPWKSFALCSCVTEKEQATVLICPVFNGRFAVPVLQTRKSTTELFDSRPLDLLWNIYDLRFTQKWSLHTRRIRILALLAQWNLLLKCIVAKSSFSEDELHGILVLRNSIAQWMHLYRMVGNIDLSSVEQSTPCGHDVHIAYRSCVQNFQTFQNWLTIAAAN